MKPIKIIEFVAIVIIIVQQNKKIKEKQILCLPCFIDFYIYDDITELVLLTKQINKNKMLYELEITSVVHYQIITLSTSNEKHS